MPVKQPSLLQRPLAPDYDLFFLDSAPATSYRKLWNEIRFAILRRPLF